LSVVLVLLLASSAAHAASVLVNFYVQSAAAWERCTGHTITQEQAVRLAAFASRRAMETVTPEELIAKLEEARRNPTACDQPRAQLGQDYFGKYLLPQMETFSPTNQDQVSSASTTQMAGP
jgi:hypothetical protein